MSNQQVSFATAGSPITRTGTGNKLYFTSKQAEWNYNNRFLWAAGILDRAAKGERFDVVVGHDKFLENVHKEYEFWSVELIGEVYVH